MSGAFANKVVLVTGASSGIGAELARQFSRAGARVVLAARNVEKLNEVAEECRRAGGDAFVVHTDVSVEASCRACIEAATLQYGCLDILVNNAGLRSHGRFDTITDLTIFETVMRVNFFGSVWCTAFALPHLKKSRGQIVAISSVSGLIGVPNRTAYGATKHAMAGFFDSLRVELQGSGVTVTVIYPSFVQSDENSRVLSPDGTPFGERATQKRPHAAMPTDECCRLILGAVARRDRQVLMTWRAKFGRVLRLISPALIDRLARATMKQN